MSTPTNPVALITGAGSGVGRATAIALSHDGFRVALNGRREDPLRQTAGLCAGDPLILQGDLSDPDQCAALARTLTDNPGRLDLLVNNAGSAPLLPLGEASPGDIRDVFQINALAPVHLVNTLWPLLRNSDTRGGTVARVISISSKATRDPFPGLGIYGCAKGALDVLALAIRNEGDPNVLGFSIALGAVETEMLRAIVSADQLPSDQTLAPEQVAAVITDIARGSMDDRNGASFDLSHAD